MSSRFPSTRQWSMKSKHIISIIMLVACLAGSGQQRIPYAWMEGSWVGDGFGGTSEEVWSAPSGNGTIMGSFRHFKADGSLNFYEFMVLDSTGLRLKHFNPDMTGWETKEDFVHFKAIAFEEKKIILKGLVYEWKSDDLMEIRLDLKGKDGEKWTEVFTMKRK